MSDYTPESDYGAAGQQPPPAAAAQWNTEPGYSAPGVQSELVAVQAAAQAAMDANTSQVVVYEAQSQTFLESLAGDSTGGHPGPTTMSTVTPGVTTPMDGDVYAPYAD